MSIWHRLGADSRLVRGRSRTHRHEQHPSLTRRDTHATSLPFLKYNNVGIARTRCLLTMSAIAASSTSTRHRRDTDVLAIRLYCGPRLLQGGHHEAEKNITTGVLSRRASS